MQSTEDHKIFKTTQKKFGQNTVFKQRKTRTKENTHVEVSKITNSRKNLNTKINYNFFYALASNQRPRELQSHTMPSRPRMFNNRQTLVTNKAATYANRLPMRSSKSGTKNK